MDNEALKTANMLAKWLSGNDVAIRECSINMTCDGVAGLTVVNVQSDGSIAIVAEQLDNEMVFNTIDEALKDLPDLFKQPAEETPEHEEMQRMQDKMSIAEQIEKIENADQLWEAEQRLTGLIEAGKIDEAEAKALKRALRAARAELKKQSVSDASMMCVLCGQPIKGHGNNAEPLAKGLCCDACNKDVVLERLRRIKTTNVKTKDMAMSRGDAIAACMAQAPIFIEHFKKIAAEPRAQSVNHWANEMQASLDNVSGIKLKSTGKFLSFTNLMDWFFTKGSDVESIMPTPMQDAYELFLEKLAGTKDVKAALIDAGMINAAQAKAEDKLSERKDGWHVLSEEGKNLGGPYKTKEEALKRLRQVEWFKKH